MMKERIVVIDDIGNGQANMHLTDGEEIIRCRDCFYSTTAKDGSLCCGVHRCGMYETDPNGYCWRAVRKDG